MEGCVAEVILQPTHAALSAKFTREPAACVWENIEGPGQPETASKMISVGSWPPAPPCASLAGVPGLVRWREHTMPPGAAVGTTELEFPLDMWRKGREMSVSWLSFAFCKANAKELGDFLPA